MLHTQNAKPNPTWLVEAVFMSAILKAIVILAAAIAAFCAADVGRTHELPHWFVVLPPSDVVSINRLRPFASDVATFFSRVVT